MKIPFRGIVKNTPAGLAQDGELEDVLNLRYKDGAWRPIPDRSAIFYALPYTNVYIHSNSGYTHYLGLKSTGEFEYFAEDLNGTPTKLPIPIPITSLTTPTFTQIGNVINIVDGGLKYLIWYNNAYVLIDSNFDGEQSTQELTGRVDLKVESDLYEDVFGDKHAYARIYYSPYLNYSDLNDFNLPANKSARKEIAIGLIKKGIAGVNKDGFLADNFFLACTAIELYDGSYIHHSNPVLMCPANDVMNRYSNLSIGGVIHDFDSRNAVFHNRIANGDDTGEGYTSIYDMDEAFEAGDGGANEIRIASMPSNIGYAHYNNPNSLVMAIVHKNVLKYKIPSSIKPELRPIVKSISVFITPGTPAYDLDNITTSQHTFPIYVTDNFTPKHKKLTDIVKAVSADNTFYKVHEIPFEQIKTTTDNDGWVPIDLKDKLGDALLTQEALPYDDFSHHSTLPQVAMTYNSKLHVANYKTLLSRGWPASHMFAHQGIGQFPAPIITYNDLFCYIEVSIKTTNGLSKVVRYANYSEFGQFGMISYPDARATNIVIYVYAEIVFGMLIKVAKKLEYKLTPSYTCNFAYYINPDLKPISIAGDIVTSSETAPVEVLREQIFSNTLKVSEVNNPFIFPVQNTYQIGNGSIIGIASNTIALSTGQFGEFPLYVFTTDGIWAMYVGGAEVNYTSSRPVSREVCNNPKSIKAIDTGVVFSTAKGIMVIAGSSTKELSEPIEGAVFDIDKLSLFKKALNHDKLTTLLSEVTGEKIHDYISSANVGYNYIESEIWFTNPLKSYSYVFSKGLWYKVKQTGNRFIDDYPKQYLLTSTGDLVDIASEVLITGSEGKERAASQQIMLLTRPLKFGDVEFKQMLTAIMRGQLTTVNLIEEATPTDILHKKWTGIHVYGSYDGERWVFLGGAEKQGELNDIGTRIERTDCRYYRIALYGNVSLNSYINYLEMDGKQSILRTKLR